MTGTPPGGDALRSPARLRAVDGLGLGARADERMDEFAEWVRRSLDVPTALVTLVRPDGQVFPGLAGPPAEWAATRSAPLHHSLCHLVVRTAAPVVVADVRGHAAATLTDSPSGMVAYAGEPLVDADGCVLGALCAIDHRPRHFSAAERDVLHRIARACSTDLDLRLARRSADAEEARRNAVETSRLRSLERSQTLLLASQAFTETATHEDVVNRIRNLVVSELRPTIVAAVMIEDGRLHRLSSVTDLGDPMLQSWSERDERTPGAAAIREGRLRHHGDRDAFAAAGYADDTIAQFRGLGLHTCVAAPLPGPEGPIGAIVLAWDRPAAVVSADLVTIASIAAFAGQAFRRADVLHHRDAVARALQNAMLTTLPTVEGLELAARYQPADARENVGGDWYDCVSLPDRAAPDVPVLSLSVGDIIGHTLTAATTMGQARSMLRQAAWDHAGQGPSAVLSAFDAANLGLDVRAAGTAVLVQLRRAASGWAMTWTNAGHPPPILLHPDGHAEQLAEHDLLFGFALTARAARTDHHRTLAPGSTLFLYTDGLVERPGSDLDAGIDALVRLLLDLRGRPVSEIVRTTVDVLARGARDDVVAFAVHVPGR